MTSKLNGQLLGEYDVIVVGGGMVGAATALGLAKLNLKVLLIEKDAPNLDWDEGRDFSIRVSALTRTSENILRNLNAWHGVEKRRFQPFTAMKVWEQGASQKIEFLAKEINEPNLGVTVENAVIQAALWEPLLDHHNIEILLGEEIKSIDYDSYASSGNNPNKEVVLELQNGQKVVADLIVGADGAASKVRSLAAIGLEQKDYQQCAVVGCVKTQFDHENACWQRYTDSGPFAFLAMPEGYSSIAWYMPLEKMQWALDLSDDQFAKEITRASGGVLGKVQQVTQRGAFPLTRRHVLAYVKPGIALVGDAAHTINPQAGQGVNIGLLDAASLVEQVDYARQMGRKIGSLPILRRYERQRRGDNAIVQRSMEVFDGVFAQQAMTASVRQTVLSQLNQSWLGTQIKSWLMQQVLNGRVDTPALAKSDKTT